MTKIKIKDTGSRIVVRAEDHAGFNPGNDIVCAAVSALICTYASFVQELSVESKIKVSQFRIKEGDVCIKLEYKKCDLIKAYTHYLAKGCAMISSQYPRNVQCLVEN